MYAGTVFNNMGYALTLSGEPDEALRYFRMSKSIRPSYHTIDFFIAQCYWLKEEYDSTLQQLRAILSTADTRDKIHAYSQLISLYYYQGQLRNAWELSREALKFCQLTKRPGDEAYFHYLAGEISRERGNMDSYAREMRLAEKLSISPFMELPLIGASYAGTGLFSDAERLLDRLSTLESIDLYFLKRREDFQHFIRGALSLARNDHGAAEIEFDLVERLHSADPYYLLAQHGLARSRAGRSDTSASRVLHDLLEGRGESMLGHVLASRTSGTWTRILFPGIHLELAKLYLGRKDTAAAVPHLERCLRCWQHADPQFGSAIDAKNLFNQITKAR